MDGAENTLGVMSQLEAVLRNKRRFLILLHDNPDPDALASGWALKYLVKESFGVKARTAYGGFIGRAENRAMARILKIPLSRIEHIRIDTYDGIALLDTQPRARNNALPDGLRCALVIDHHPRRRDLKSDVAIIDTRVGATATLMVEVLEEAGLAVPSGLATALSYAIRSETQDLGREAGPRDIRAYLQVLPKASMRKLAHIIHPKLPKTYFATMGDAIRRATSYRSLICAHLGDVPYPEIVAEAADFLLNHERISWTFCTGRYRETLYLSLRSTNTGARAGRLLRRMVPEKNSAGGHDTFAGGKISLKGYPPEKVEQTEVRLSERFAQLLGYVKAEWRPLIDSTAKDSSSTREVS